MPKKKGKIRTTIVEAEGVAVVKPEDARVSFDIDRWLRLFESPLTRKQYGRDVLGFLQWAWERAAQGRPWPGYVPLALIRAVDRRTVEEYLIERRDGPYRYRRTYAHEGEVEMTTKGGVSPGRHNSMLAALRSLAGYLKDFDHIDSETYTNIRRIRSLKKRRTWQEPVPPDVMLAVLDSIEPRNRMGGDRGFYDEMLARRDDALLRVMWACGMRKGAVVNLKVQNFHAIPEKAPERFWFKWLGKGNVWRRWRVHERVAQRMAAWLRDSRLKRRPGWPAFPSLTWTGALKFGKFHREVRSKETMKEKREVPHLPNRFTTVDRMIARRFVEAGFHTGGKPDYKPHGIRAGACVAGLFERKRESGVWDIEWARKFLGHRGYGSLDPYIHAAMEMEDDDLPAVLSLGLADADGFEDGDGE